MSSTVTLLKTSAVTAIQADLEAAVASSATAAASSAVNSAVSATAAAGSATAASSSAAAAAGSAATALNAIVDTFKGGVAGASVPATSPAAGDYYRITAAGTAQSKTWATGDLAIYNGTSGSWTQISGNLVDPSTLAAQRNALAPAQALSGNGTAGSTLTLASVPSGDQTIPLDFDVPSSNPSRAMGILALGGAYTTANSQVIYITAAGALQVEAYGATSGDVRYSYSAGFVAAYAGTRVRCIVTISSGVLAINVNGTALTLTNGTAGSAPAWGATLASGLVYVGKMAASDYYFSGTLRLLGIENRALSAAEVLQVYQTGSFPASDFASPAATNTALNAGTFSDASFPYSTPISGASATGFSAASTGAAFCMAACPTAFAIKPGKRFRLTYTLTLNSGTAPTAYIANPGIDGKSNAVVLSVGSNSTELTTDEDYATAKLAFYNSSSATNYTLANITLVPLGLLVAPSTKGGCGPQQRDMSGNNCPINLPGDGVDGGVAWTNPTDEGWFSYTRTSSGYLFGGWAIIPSGYYIAEMWISGNGVAAVTVGESAGTWTNVVASYVPAATPAPATLLVRTTSNRMLYLYLSASITCTVTVRIAKIG